jgi:pyruvate/2-oxoacid:ferredoxin oxidoreductase beta subunit
LQKVNLPKDIGLIYKSLPADRKVKVRVGKNGKPFYIWPNMFSLPPHVMKAISKNNMHFVYPPFASTSFKHIPWIINLCGDADEYENAMKALNENFKNVPIFNHPKGIMRSRRDRSASILEGIEKFDIPKCIRLSPNHFSDFENTFKKNNFSFPVIVRPARSQSSVGVIKVDNVADWRTFESLPWANNHYYMTQFVDFSTKTKTKNIVYAKGRVMFIGKKVYFRHLFLHNHWQINMRKQIGDSKKQREEEYDHISKIKKSESFKNIINKVRDRIGLDGFILDFGWDFETQSATFFEVSAAAQLDYSELLSPFEGEKSEQINKDYKKSDIDLVNILNSPQAWINYKPVTAYD